MELQRGGKAVYPVCVSRYTLHPKPGKNCTLPPDPSLLRRQAPETGDAPAEEVERSGGIGA